MPKLWVKLFAQYCHVMAEIHTSEVHDEQLPDLEHALVTGVDSLRCATRASKLSLWSIALKI
jgi:hypothetical protein